MKHYIVFVSFLVLLLSCKNKQPISKSTDSDIKNTEKPNIIIILTDDQGYADVGFNGCKDIPTPNIDRIANQGVKFTNGYVTYPVCGPSRAGLITGRYQSRFGFGRNPICDPDEPTFGLPLSEKTLATVLKSNGYTNIALGKWHLGTHETLHPLKRGFDEFFGFLSGGHQYFPELWTLNDISEIQSQFDGYNTKLLKNNTRVDEKEYLTDALSRQAVTYIKENKENPFFMYLAYNAPHTPMQATKKYLDRFPNIKDSKRKTYAAMVSAVDDGVGIILDELNKLNLEENTLVFFLSDNGGPEQHNASDNGQLRGGKSDLFEGGIRVPFALQWKGHIPSGTIYDKPISSLDIFATAVEVSHTNISNNKKLDGVNLIPFITHKKEGVPHDYLFWRKFDSQQYAVRNGNTDSKMIISKKTNGLYHLHEDIGEQNNLKDEKSSEYETLNNLRTEWEKGLIPPIFKPLKQHKQHFEERNKKLNN
ncbi:cerebroside-sulfatase [Flavobacteriaceae bacterium UJ101]|nr:cerebroside-sulfatase [Flavobacteriaceae bacterium UJ101]